MKLYVIEEISFMNDVDESDWDFISEKYLLWLVLFRKRVILLD